MLEAAEPHARRVKAVSWLEKAVPGAAELTRFQNRGGGGGAARCGGSMTRQQEREWVQEGPERLGGTLISGEGSQWAGKPVAWRRRQGSEEARGGKWS